MEGAVLIKVIIVDDEITIREGIKKAIDWKHHGMESALP